MPTPRTSPDQDEVPAGQVTATAESGKPVVLSTGRDDEFVIPGKKDDGSDELRITSAGLALSQADAKRVKEAAQAAGVTLIEKDGS